MLKQRALQNVGSVSKKFFSLRATKLVARFCMSIAFFLLFFLSFKGLTEKNNNEYKLVMILCLAIHLLSLGIYIAVSSVIVSIYSLTDEKKSFF